MRTHLLSVIVYGFVMIVILVFHHLQMITLTTGDALFLTSIIFLGAFYRPHIAFWFLVGLLPLEIINLAPVAVALPFMLRPYQLLGGILFAVVIIKILTTRTHRTMPQWHAIDIILGSVIILGFVASVFAQNIAGAFMQALIVLSFFVLYVLARFFVQNTKDLVQPVEFFLLGVTLVSLYSILQNWLFAIGGNHLEIMPGRPNATFAEADWLSMFLVVAIAALYAVLLHLFTKKNTPILRIIMSVLSLSIVYSALFLTVARSAWLGAIAISIVFCGILFWRYSTKTALLLSGLIVLTITASYSFVILTHLTHFSLTDRATSTTSGKQVITISCTHKQNVPQTVESVADLADYHCTHINLEDIAAEQARGHYVTEINRPDPNVSVRKETYKKAWAAISQNWLVGYGWGSSGTILGTDEAGTPLNASNIFLELWLSVGIFGVLAFVGALGIAIYSSVKELVNRTTTIHGAYPLFALLAIIAIIIPNLFNAGLLMGFVWVALGVITSLVYLQRKNLRKV